MHNVIINQNLKKISQKNKYLIIGGSILTFLILNWGLGPTTVFGLVNFIQNITDKFFGVSTSTFDYLVIASFPLFAGFISVRQENVSAKNIIFNYFKILLSSSITFILGLIYLDNFGKLKNPLIPEYLVAENFTNFSVITIFMGIIFPIILSKKHTKIDSEIENIGINNNA